MDWNDIKCIVKEGKARSLFPLGSQFPVEKIDSNGNRNVYLFDLVDFDFYSLKKYGHTVVLMLHDILYGHEMDPREAFYCCSSALDSGFYTFKVSNQFWYPEDNGVCFYFSVDKDIPAGTQLWLDMKYNETLDGKRILFFTSPLDQHPFGETLIKRGINGTFLGVTDGSSANMNFMHRSIFGSNNYKESGLRQWLNSKDISGDWWKPQTRFDRPPAYADSDDGFLYGMDDEFLSALIPVDIHAYGNDIYESDGKFHSDYVLSDRVFVPSIAEVGLQHDSYTQEKPFRLFDVHPQLRCKTSFLLAETPDRRWWLRNVKKENASSFYLVDSDGSLFVHTGYYGFGVAPVCVI